MKVSIIIPVFNSEKYLAKSIESALSASWPYKEIIVVDDGSTDNSYGIAQSYSALGVKVLNIENSGAAVARNHGLNYATGEVIQFLDADDIIHPEKFNIQMSNFELYGLNIISLCGWEMLVNDKNLFLNSYTPTIEKLVPSDLLIEMWTTRKMFQTSCWMCSKNLIESVGGWNTSLPNNPNDDGEIFSRLVLSAQSVIYCDVTLVFYREPVGRSSLSQLRSNVAVKSLFETCKIYENGLLEKRNDIKARKAIYNVYVDFIYEFGNTNPDLYLVAKQRLRDLGFRDIKRRDKGAFYVIQSVFGFEGAMRLRKILKGF